MFKFYNHRLRRLEGTLSWYFLFFYGDVCGLLSPLVSEHTRRHVAAPSRGDKSLFCTSRATSCCKLMQYRCNRSQRQVAATNHLAWPREFLCTEIFDRILSSTQFAKSNQLECVNLCLVARQIISQNDHCRHEAICLCDLSPNVFRPLILIFHPSLPSPSPLIPFFLLLSQLSRRTRAETLAMQANRMCNTIADRPESFRRHALGAIRATEQRHDVSVIALASGNIYWQYTISVCDHFHSPFFSLPDNTPCLPPLPPSPPKK